MGKTDEAARLAISIANDPSHGYDQGDRWGPDFDCSSFLIYVWERVGVPLKSAGASYTGNMKGAALSVGFRDVTVEVNRQNGAGLQIGDILLNERSHTAMFVGNGNLVHASINEYGGITGGKPGDQTGREICVRSYYNSPWDCVLRYGEDKPTSADFRYHDYTYKVETNLLKSGDYGPQVRNMQVLLKSYGFYDGKLDGSFGEGTYNALRAFQESAGIGVDGEWGGESFKAAWNYSGGE